MGGAPPVYDDVIAGTIWVMVNEGSTPLPYEPYGWVHSLRKLGNSTDTITTLPAVVYADGTNATVGLKGNMSQSGTPSPTTPIQPSECGEITANILSVYKENYSINANGEETLNTVALIYKANVVVSGSTFTLAFGGLSVGDTVRIHAYTGDTWKEQIAAIVITQVPFTFTVASEVDNIRISIRKTATDVTMTDGQYKIPISSAGQTTPVYLGEVQSTRLIKKLVLTGEENFNTDTYLRFSIYIADIKTSTIRTGRSYCSHYECLYHAEPYDNDWNNVYYQSGGTLHLHDRRFDTVSDFKAYLAAQYANGTPVTIWYVLSSATTGTVNEPLMKIGTYADEVSNISIPVTAGGDTLSVGTTVQPSEVTVNYKGWHTGVVHESESGQWD